MGAPNGTPPGPNPAAGGKSSSLPAWLTFAGRWGPKIDGGGSGKAPGCMFAPMGGNMGTPLKCGPSTGAPSGAIAGGTGLEGAPSWAGVGANMIPALSGVSGQGFDAAQGTFPYAVAAYPDARSAAIRHRAARISSSVGYRAVFSSSFDPSLEERRLPLESLGGIGGASPAVYRYGRGSRCSTLVVAGRKGGRCAEEAVCTGEALLGGVRPF